ncbi:MAG: hypothetical protein JXA66_05200 [Oligoflexia bacterium]|nr:hypothetical protein [Oligoflexia bacterium]
MSSVLCAARGWTVKDAGGSVEAIDITVADSPMIKLVKGGKCIETYMISVLGKDSFLVLEDKDGVNVRVKSGSMIGLGRYKEISSDLILIRGSVRFLVPDIKGTVSVETSSLVFTLGKKTDVTVDSVAKESSYETTFCAAEGGFKVSEVDGRLIASVKKGRKVSFWKKRKITDDKCEIVPEIKVEKKAPAKAVVKKAVPPQKPKKVNEEDTYTVGAIEQELFSEIQSDEELQKELIKISKEKDIEISGCAQCEKGWSRVVFAVPEGINYVSPEIYNDKTLPALFFQTEKGQFTNRIFTGYKAKEVKEGQDARFVYYLPAGKYYVSIIKGPAFMIDVDKGRELVYNVSAFVSSGINAEIVLPLTGKKQPLIPSKTAPMFVYPGKYSFDIIKKGMENTRLELTIKPGAVMIVAEEKS